MHGCGALLGRAKTDDGLRADERGLVGDGARGRQRGGDGLAALAVDMRHDMPAIRLEAVRGVVVEPAHHLAVDGNAVVVIDRDELAELLHAGEGGRLVRNALHHAAIAHEHIGVMIDDGVAGPVEGGRQRALGQRHSDRIGKSLAQWPRGGLDAEMHFALRVPRSLGAELPKILDFLHRQGIAGEMQHRVEQHRGVAVGEHESVAVHPCRIARIELKHVSPQDFGDVRHPHGRARMARIRLLDRIHGEGSNGVCKVAAGGHGELLNSTRQAAYCLRCAPCQQCRVISVALPARVVDLRRNAVTQL